MTVDFYGITPVASDLNDPLPETAEQFVQQQFVSRPPNEMAQPAAQALADVPPEHRQETLDAYARQLDGGQLQGVLRRLDQMRAAAPAAQQPALQALSADLASAIRQSSPSAVKQAVQEGTDNPALAAQRELVAVHRVEGERPQSLTNRLFQREPAVMAQPLIQKFYNEHGQGRSWAIDSPTKLRNVVADNLQAWREKNHFDANGVMLAMRAVRSSADAPPRALRSFVKLARGRRVHTDGSRGDSGRAAVHAYS